MDKRVYFLNNPSSESIRVPELGITLEPGVSNLFELNPELTYEKIDYCVRMGTLHAAMDNGLCYIVPDTIARSLTPDVIIRNPQQVQVFQSRVKTVVFDGEQATSVFDSEDDADLFADEDVAPAREIEEQLKKDTENVQNIEATIKDANLSEKPIEHRYTPPPAVRTAETQQKIKNDIQMGYETCNGRTAGGKRCMRQAKTGSRFCGLHKDQA